MITAAISKALKNKIGCKQATSINETGFKSPISQFFIYETDKGLFFVKVSDNSDIDPFVAEAKGLEALAETETIRVPLPYYYGYYEEQCFLILEHLNLRPHTAETQELLGRKLAELHLYPPRSERFGFEMDGTIGTTKQKNLWNEDWIAFFRDCRLSYQLRLVEEKYGDEELIKRGEKLLDKLDSYFSEVTITPSLLHGDLWNGNSAVDEEGNPVLYDPAAYYGHSEADLSIAKMFGGFVPAFFSAYHELIPKSSGFEERQQLYQLYHYLNHYVIFGGSYRPACLSIFDALSC